MKNRYFLSMVVSVILIAAGVGCTTLQETTDGYENEGRSYRNSSYYDPFYNNVSPVLVRDAYTGRLFYVYPNNSLSNLNAYNFDNRYSNNRFNNNRYYSRPSSGSRPQASEEQRQQQREKLEESRKRILGRSN